MATSSFNPSGAAARDGLPSLPTGLRGAASDGPGRDARARRLRVRLTLGAALALFGSIAAAGGCSCGAESVGARRCLVNADCADGDRCVAGECVPNQCGATAECCPGETCGDQGRCVDARGGCTDNADCQVAGQDCVPRGGSSAPVPTAGADGGAAASDRVCAFARCGTSPAAGATDGGARDAGPPASCGDGLVCFNGSCVAEPPCGAGCAAGQVCATPIARCVDPPAGSMGCDQSCMVGFVLVFTDPATMFGEGCVPATCACVELPPLARGDVGRFSDLAVIGGKPVASAYDAKYGDLVFVEFDTPDADGADPVRIEYVDGLPDTGPIVGAASGIRGGIALPGPNVGRWTSLAVDAQGGARIAYHDVDSRALKFAARAVDGTWRKHTVRTPQGEAVLGRYTALALGGDGKPVIAFFSTKLGDAATGLTSRLELAIAQNATPQSEADWDVSLVEEAPIPGPPCGSGCARGERCVRVSDTGGPGGGPTDQCVRATGDCSNECGSGETCFEQRCLNEVEPPSTEDLPEGAGLFPSLVLIDGRPTLAYYDRTRGNLKLARASSAAPGGPDDWTIVVLDGEGTDGADTGDVGLFPSLAVAPDGKLGIAYQDATDDDLRFYLGDGTVAGGVIDTIDTGLFPPEAQVVGADASLAFDGAGNAYVAYQNASTNDLMWARRNAAGGWRSPEALLTEGAWGYFSRLALDRSTAFVSSFKYGYDDRRRPANRFRVVSKSIP